MRRHIHTIKPKFVEFIPTDGKDLVPGVVFISMTYNTVVHRCPCGCGGLSEFTLDPIRFQIKYDGEYDSFEPSIGTRIYHVAVIIGFEKIKFTGALLWKIGNQPKLGIESCLEHSMNVNVKSMAN